MKKVGYKTKITQVKNNYTTLTIFVLGTVVLGSFGSIFTVPAIPEWYRLLDKPSFSPPNWVFGPVWTILFILMGIAVYFIYRHGIRSIQIRDAVLVYGVQFFFNLLWSYLFFGLRSPALGLSGILVLWVSIAATMKLFYKIEKVSAYLLIPYFLWVSFATLLNAAIYILN
jgi:translocator protein